MLLFPTAPIEQPTLIEYLEPETKIEIQVQPELTVQEKIDQNFYNCNTDIQWIRADNAECLAKQVNTPVVTESTSQPTKKTSQATSGWYTAGYCTAWVADHRYVPNGWGDAISWKYNAQSAGWYVGPTPVAGAIGWSGNHVVYVESVGDGTVTISEQNYAGVYSVRTVTRPIDYYTYLY